MSRALLTHHRHFLGLYRLMTEVLQHRRRRHQRAGMEYVRQQKHLVRKMTMLFPILDPHTRASMECYFKEISKVAGVVRGSSVSLRTDERTLNEVFQSAFLSIQRAGKRSVSDSR